MNVAKLSAKAAELNANALVSAERAWVIVEVKTEKILFSTAPTIATNAYVGIYCRNAGSTPAWVYELWVCARVFVGHEHRHGGGVKLYPDPMEAMHRAGETAACFTAIHPLSKEMNPIETWTWLTAKGHADQSDYLHIFGYVKYRDAFSSDRMTWFGYIVPREKEMVRIPDEAYNRNS